MDVTYALLDLCICRLPEVLVDVLGTLAESESLGVLGTILMTVPPENTESFIEEGQPLE